MEVQKGVFYFSRFKINFVKTENDICAKLPNLPVFNCY